MKTFALIDKTIGRKFSFHAVDHEEAVSKAKAWCRYHSWNYDEQIVEIKEISEKEPGDLHNEYVD